MTLTGDQGIINRISSAKKSTEEAAIKEDIRLAYENALIGKQVGKNETFVDIIRTDLEKTYGSGNVTATDNGDGTYTVTINNNKTFDIDANGNVTKQGASIILGTATVTDVNGAAIEQRIQGEGKAYVRFTASLTGSNDLTVTATKINPTTGENIANATELTPTLTSGVWVTEVDSNGTYKFSIRGTVEGEVSTTTTNVAVNSFSNLPAGLTIGSTVTYNPAGAKYTWKGEYATTATITTTNNVNTTSDDKTLDSRPEDNSREEGDRDAGADRITSWKVLDIDEDENIKLVPASQPATTVKLQGANGYNNAVYLLNEACKTLYVNPSLGITADNVRNINIEDIENAMKDTAISTAKGEGYPVSMKNANNDLKSTGYTGNRYYPLIYEKELKSIINNGTENTTGWGVSRQDSLIGRTDASTIEFNNNTNPATPLPATNGFIKASTSIKPYHTNYNVFINTTNAKTTAHSTVLCPSSNAYWVASRWIGTFDNICYFYITCVASSQLQSADLFSSSRGTSNPSRSLFPVITLISEHISGNSIDGYIVE